MTPLGVLISLLTDPLEEAPSFPYTDAKQPDAPLGFEGFFFSTLKKKAFRVEGSGTASTS